MSQLIIPALRKDAFLCHATEDKPMLRSIAAGLERHGITVWMDEAGIGAGELLEEKITQAISSADKFCCFITSNSVAKRWVKFELAEALARDDGADARFIIPVLLHECIVPEALAKRHFVDLRNWDTYSLGMQQLAQAIKGAVTTLPADFTIAGLDSAAVADAAIASLPADQAAIEFRLRYDRWTSRKISTLRNYCRLNLHQIITYCETSPHILLAPIYNSIGEICYGVKWRVMEDYGSDGDYMGNVRRFILLLLSHPSNNRYPDDVMEHFISYHRPDEE